MNTPPVQHRSNEDDASSSVRSLPATLRGLSPLEFEETAISRSIWAASRGDIKTLREIRNNGGSIFERTSIILIDSFLSVLRCKEDYDGRYSLHLACCHGHYQTVEYLISVDCPLNVIL